MSRIEFFTDIRNTDTIAFIVSWIRTLYQVISTNSSIMSMWCFIDTIGREIRGLLQYIHQKILSISIRKLLEEKTVVFCFTSFIKKSFNINSEIIAFNHKHIQNVGNKKELFYFELFSHFINDSHCFFTWNNFVSTKKVEHAEKKLRQRVLYIYGKNVVKQNLVWIYYSWNVLKINTEIYISTFFYLTT